MLKWNSCPWACLYKADSQGRLVVNFPLIPKLVYADLDTRTYMSWCDRYKHIQTKNGHLVNTIVTRPRTYSPGNIRTFVYQARNLWSLGTLTKRSIDIRAAAAGFSSTLHFGKPRPSPCPNPNCRDLPFPWHSPKDSQSGIQNLELRPHLDRSFSGPNSPLLDFTSRCSTEIRPRFLLPHPVHTLLLLLARPLMRRRSNVRGQSESTPLCFELQRLNLNIPLHRSPGLSAHHRHAPMTSGSARAPLIRVFPSCLCVPTI